MPTTVLAVCTGNICRSPAIQLLLDARTDSTVSVVSAGTRAIDGGRVDPQMAELLTAQGLDPASFRARRLVPDLITQADLVITATRAHRASVVRRVPEAVRRTFTLLELAVLLRGATPLPAELSDAERWAQVPEIANGRRSGRRLDPGSLDVEDPYGRRSVVFRRVLTGIETALDGVTNAVSRSRQFRWP
ncbi:low molecular weight phosphatase family protein [Promicromonospora iranensis]|uniref:protein-tyrosine-phosphatase n=1 Tax=Promicromonospora iranensis TaxID=1105144 RepID=A0ABU2CM92_9MICO|nr:low molecular weight phosphatase family protein [Promicromonospora iranensis]MDR7382448.1 protein-tyrosine phosphatase [Promicromonospora iranensis]